MKLKRDKNNYIITVEIRYLIVVLIFFSTIFFNGGIYKLIDLRVLNSYYDLLYLVFYLSMPLASTYVLFYFFEHESFSFKIKRFSIFLSALVLFFVLTNNLKSPNLFSDEIYHTNQCFNIINQFLNNTEYDHLGIFSSFSYSNFLRLFLALQWLVSIAILISILKIIDRPNGINIFLTSIFILKLLLIYIMVDSDVHPPMNSFIPSLSLAIFGINPISIKSSIIIVNILFIVYLYNRINLSELSIIFISSYIFLIPIIGNFTVYFEQALYSFICFTVITIEIFYKKLKPQYLFLIISIFSLFRYPSIAAYPAAFLYSFLFYYQNNSVNEIVRKLFKSMIPITLSIPIIIFPLIFGTPTTNRIDRVDYNLDMFINFSGSLTENAFNVFGISLVIPIVAIFVLILLKNFRILVYISIVYFSYHFLHKLPNIPLYLPKYYLEQFGYLFVFSIVFLVEKFDRIQFIKQQMKIGFYALLFFLFSYHKSYTIKQNINEKKHSKYFGLLNNHHAYLFDYIESNNIYDRTLIIGIDYGPTFLAYYNASLSDYINYRNNWLNYKKLKYKNEIEWLKLDSDMINSLENIEYIFITDFIYENNKVDIDELVNLYGWELIGYIPETYNFSDVHLLKKV